MLAWEVARSSEGVSRPGLLSLTFSGLRERFIAPARTAGTRRESIENPVRPLFELYGRAEEIQVMDVTLTDIEAVRDLYAYVMEPAWRIGVRLRIHADRPLDQLDPERLVDPDMGFPLTLERLQYLASRMRRGERPEVPPPGGPAPLVPLDAEQFAAVAAPYGVTQIIAPAGSGKTTVLVERVRELIRRGADPRRILALTFNRAAAQEMRSRLQAAGVGGVQARTFHGLGRAILAEEGLLVGRMRTLTLGQWRRLCAIISRQHEWIEPTEAREIISNAKLVHLMTPDEYRQIAARDAHGEAGAALYALHEKQQRAEGCHDFDDLLLHSVRALRGDRALRRRWQQRFHHVLVDEHQDIEPAQEILTRTLAAPQDSMFAVGDGDQCLYGWRRASVERIVQFDQAYPGVQRVGLRTNYRCPPNVVAASAKLIAANRLRFPQTIMPAPNACEDPAGASVTLGEHQSSGEAAAWAAARLQGRKRGEITVLARTTRLLREVAEACVPLAIRISAPPRVFESHGARAVVEAHLRLAAWPGSATPEDVALIMRHPTRGLPPGDETPVAERLRDGADWEAALALQGGRDGRIADAAIHLAALSEMSDARAFVRMLRGPWGLDRHFAEIERAFRTVEQVEGDELDDMEREAAGKTVERYAQMVQQRQAELLFLRDDEHGVELCTIHGAKGREWPEVIVHGFEIEQMPNARALDVTPQDERRGEGMEAERRIAYVAMTRARQRLHLLATAGKASSFADEAEIRPAGAHSTAS